jgi:hypothetical protein
MSGNWFDTAQICLNGHVINEAAESYPEENQKFCSKCGEKTIIRCQYCEIPIKGYHHCSVVVMADFIPPKFCHNCGKPYPWTESKLKAAQELIDEAEKLTEQEKDILKQSLDDLVRGAPNTQVAALRFKKYTTKAGEVVMGGLRDIMVDIASETAKKILFSQS